MAEAIKKDVNKFWQITAVFCLLAGLIASGASVWFAPRWVESSLQQKSNASLEDIAQKLDSVVLINKAEDVTPDLVEILSKNLPEEGYLPHPQAVVTVMRGDVPLFSLRDREVVPFSSPVDKRYVYGFLSEESDLYYLITIPRASLEGPIHQRRLLLISLSLLIGLGSAGICLWLAARKGGRP